MNIPKLGFAHTVLSVSCQPVMIWAERHSQPVMGPAPHARQTDADVRGFSRGSAQAARPTPQKDEIARIKTTRVSLVHPFCSQPPTISTILRTTSR
jgi:hypothetical protein